MGNFLLVKIKKFKYLVVSFLSVEGKAENCMFDQAKQVCDASFALFSRLKT